MWLRGAVRGGERREGSATLHRLSAMDSERKGLELRSKRTCSETLLSESALSRPSRSALLIRAARRAGMDGGRVMYSRFERIEN